MRIAIVNGAFVGLIYGLFAVGLVLAYRASRVLNFAHGETGMVAAFVFAEMWSQNGVSLGLSLVVALVLAAALGGATEWLVVRPLRDRPPITTLVATSGVAALLLVWATRRYSTNARFLEPIVTGTGPRVLGLTIQPMQILILATALLLLVSLTLLYTRTSFGLRMRATAIDAYATGHVGVNTTAVSLASWTLAGVLAGVSAILIAPLVVFNVFFMTSLLVRGLAAALLGGLTNIYGAFVAGIVLGVSEAIVGYQVSTPGAVELCLAVLVIAVLLVRPSGLLGTEY